MTGFLPTLVSSERSTAQRSYRHQLTLTAYSKGKHSLRNQTLKATGSPDNIEADSLQPEPGLNGSCRAGIKKYGLSAAIAAIWRQEVKALISPL